MHKINKRQPNRGAKAVADSAASIKGASKRLAGGDGGGDGAGSNCSPAYPDFCTPPPPDRNCDDVNRDNFTVKPPDPHGFDSDGDGVGCERADQLVLDSGSRENPSQPQLLAFADRKTKVPIAISTKPMAKKVQS